MKRHASVGDCVEDVHLRVLAGCACKQRACGTAP